MAKLRTARKMGVVFSNMADKCSGLDALLAVCAPLFVRLRCHTSRGISCGDPPWSNDVASCVETSEIVSRAQLYGITMSMGYY